MTSSWRRMLLRQMWHPSMEELVLFLDEPRSKRRVEAHLKTCWSCRLALDKINRAILAYMEVRETSFTGSRGFPKHALADFDRRLDQLALESESPTLFPVFLSQQVQDFFLSRWAVWLATCISCLLIVVLLIFRLTSSVSVSAEEVLSRVKRAEVEQLTRTSQPVLYEKLRLHRHSRPDRSEVVTWEVWSDTRNKRSRRQVEELQSMSTERNSAPENGVGKRRSRTQTGEETEPILPAAFADLEQLFRSHQANFAHPLSADSFEAWSHALGGRLEKTMHSKIANGDDTFVLRASGEGPFQQNSVMSAELTIRKRDWQTVEERLQVKTTEGTTDYILEKVASSVIALNRLSPSIFGETGTPSAPARALTVPQTKLLVEEEQPTEGDLLVTEVEAWYGLHSVSACVGRPLNVAQTGRGRVEVQGVVEREENKVQILAALQGIPHLISELQTAAQAGVASPIQVNRTESVTIESGLIASPQKLVTEELLKKFLATQECAEGPAEEKSRCIQQKIAHFSQDILSTSEATLAQAWALQRLANWYSHVSSNGLRLSARGLVEIMVRDHLTSFRQERERLRTLLRPVLGYLLQELNLPSEPIELEPSTAPRGRRIEWVTYSQHLCSEVERTTNLLLGMFVETNNPVRDIKEATKDLLPAMGSLDDAFEKLEGELVFEFSGTSKVVSNDKSQGK